MRKFAANVMELAKKIEEDEQKKNSITKGENSFNRYYHYTKCSYLFSFTHIKKRKNHLTHPPPLNTHELPLSSSSLPLLLYAALSDKQNQFSAYRNENETICHEKGKIKVTRWFHAKNERTQIKLEYGHRRQTISFFFVFFFLFSTPLKYI